METIILISLFVFGLAIGSFLGALTYRAPLNIKISKGRSKCPKCHNTIAWYDNIPLISFLLLGGKCRFCKKSISSRYPVIELATGIIFVLIFLFRDSISQNINWLNGMGVFLVPTALVIGALLLAVAVIDWEHQLILDEFVFVGLFLVLILFLYLDFQQLFVNLLSGVIAALFLLSIHLLTLGRGMGLGDVKLAVFVGAVLGPPLTLLWIFLAFIIGGVVGVILLGLGKAKMKQKIAFGPFLVVSAFLVIFFGYSLKGFLLPGLF